MLVSMTVRNIALIEQLQIEFQKGMQVLSGETGAGKSIIVDSINLVLGERADRGLIRSGCDRASVEALVDISDCPQAAAVLAEQQLEAEGGLISIQREISTGERNLCRVCGIIVPLAFLRKLTALLVDVHGQHAHQSLLDAKNHMAFLDSFGDEAFQEQRQRVEERYRLWRESSVRFSALRKENEQRAQRQEYLESRVRELDAAQLTPGETERLTAERARFASAERIDGAVRTAYAAVMGGGREASAMDQLRDAMEALRRIEELDPRYKALADRLSSAFYEAEELGIELRDVLESENFDPERGFSFSTYAVPVILGEIKRIFRDGGSVKVGRALKEKARAAMREKDALTAELGCEPTVGQLAQRLGSDVAQTAQLLNAVMPAVSLTACTDDGEGQIDLPVESPENAASELIALREVIALLDDRDREMISLRYYRGMTQSRTAELLGMSQVQVSRREKAVLALLRRNLSA